MTPRHFGGSYMCLIEGCEERAVPRRTLCFAHVNMVHAVTIMLGDEDWFYLVPLHPISERRIHP